TERDRSLPGGHRRGRAGSAGQHRRAPAVVPRRRLSRGDYRRLRAILRALRASLRLRFSLARSTLRLGAVNPPRSAEGWFIIWASWLTSTPANFFIAAICLKPGIL